MSEAPRADVGAEAALIWCPFADLASAEAAAAILLDERLVACANIMPPMRVMYRWNGERAQGEEVGALFKTVVARLDAAIRRLEAVHPYDVPAITAWRCDAAAPATLSWLTAELVGR